MLLVISTGCFRTNVVYCGFAKDYRELKGALSIASNKPQVVTILGDLKTVTSKDLGGMIAVRREDLKLLVQRSNELKALKESTMKKFDAKDY